MNKVTVLPKDLKVKETDSLQIYNYRVANDIQKTKINLSKNTISFLRIGDKEVIGDDKTVRINNQHFVIMKSGNCLMTEKISNSEQIYRSLLLFFSDEEAISFLEKHKLYSTYTKDQKSFYIFEYDSFIQHFVESLEKILQLPKVAQEKLLKTKFEEIMLYLVHQNSPAFLNGIIQQIDNKVNQLINIVNNNIHNKLSLEELAFLSNMSVSTFKREFFKLYKKTPIKWFNEERLNHIALLLKTQKKRPNEVYEAAGYENFSNFVQAFKKKFGVTPKKYQNQI